MIPCSWQSILSLGEMFVRVLGARDEKERAQNSQLQRLTVKVVARFLCVQFYCPWLLLVSGWIPRLQGRLQWARESPAHSAITSSTHLLDFASYRRTAVSTQWCHLCYLGLC